MLFNSYAFLFCFLPFFLLFWQSSSLVKTNFAHRHALVLLLFSIIFYAFWGLTFLVLLFLIIFVNYAFGSALAQMKEGDKIGFFAVSRKGLLLWAIIFNLLPLAWFKYSWFIISNIALIFKAHWQFTPPDLPLGISFYTFIQIAWLVGIYREQFKPAGFFRHAVFSSCFAYVISGPIVRYDQLGWQLDGLKNTDSQNLASGFSLFTIGFAKKVLLADSIGFYANTVFNAAEKSWPLSGMEAWLGSFCYTFQLYFDFSGYTDMALGLGLMIGLRLPENFNSPYKSTGIVDFWRRWHITLSSWLRDFLYIPMGGNRRGKIIQYRNLFLTMLIGGIWHGAGWTYMVWGALHGMMLGVNHFFRASIKNTRAEEYFAKLPVRIFFIIFTFFCLDLCWVVFRALSLDGAMAIYSAMFTGPYMDAAGQNFLSLVSALFPNNYFVGWQPFALLGASFAICWFMPNSHEIMSGGQGLLRWKLNRSWAISLGLLFVASLLFLSRQSTFLYFQF